MLRDRRAAEPRHEIAASEMIGLDCVPQPQEGPAYGLSKLEAVTSRWRDDFNPSAGETQRCSSSLSTNQRHYGCNEQIFGSA